MALKNKEIAEILGITPSAVSYAIHNKKGVSEETRRKVLELLGRSDEPGAEHTNESGKWGNLLLVIHKKHGKIIVDKPFFSMLLQNIETATKNSRYNLIVSHYTSEQDLRSYIHSLSRMDVKGVILQTTEMSYEDLQEYKRLPFPIVIVDSIFDLSRFDSVSLDDENAFFNAVNYVYQLGHRRIGFLRSSIQIFNFQHHYDGYIRGLSYFDLAFNPDDVIDVGPNILDSYHEVMTYLERLSDHSDMPTVFLADNDYIALGALRALKESGFRVPEDQRGN